MEPYEIMGLALVASLGFTLGYFIVPELLGRWKARQARARSYAKRAATRRANAAAKRTGNPF